MGLARLEAPRVTFARALALLAGMTLISVVSGCMTEPPENDLPWNKPQSWEGTPALPPGMFQNQ